MVEVRPVRLQLSRKKGFNLQALSLATNGLPAISCARPGRYGNQNTVADYGSAEEAVLMFEHDLDKASVFHPNEYEAYLAPLRGKNLACYCGAGQSCHVDILLDRAALPICESVPAPQDQMERAS